jgi:hypothetical protein
MKLNIVSRFGRPDKGRVALLALLGIPILIVIHVALFSQPLLGEGVKYRKVAGDHLVLQGHWQSSEQIPSYFVVECTTERDSRVWRSRVIPISD